MNKSLVKLRKDGSVALTISLKEFETIYLENPYKVLEDLFYPLSKYKLKQFAMDMGIEQKRLGRPVRRVSDMIEETSD